MPTAGELFGAAPALPEPVKQPPKTVPVGELFGQPPAETPPPDEMGTGEKILWNVGGVAVPVVAGVGGTMVGGPFVGAGAGAAASGGMEALRQRREKALGIRKEYSPGTIAFEAGMGALPGAPLEKIGIESLAPKIAARTIEGGIMGGGSTAARTRIDTGEWPTAGELFTGTALGAVTGGVLGGGMEAIHAHGAGTGEAAPRVEGAPAAESVAGGPAPEATAAATPPPRAEPQPQQMAFDQPSFRKVPGLHEAAFGEKPTPARPRDAARLAGEIDSVDRQFGHLPEDSRTFLKQVKIEQADSTAWRARETQPVQRTKDLADELVFDPVVAAQKARGETWKPEELHAAGSHIADLLDDIAASKAKVQANPDDAVAKLELQKNENLLVLSVHAFEGAKAEQGRGLNILKYQMNALRKGDPALIKAALRRGANPEQILQMMQLPDDASKMKALVALQTPTKMQTFKSFWMSNLLAGPKTLLRNMVGNTLPPTLDIVTTPFAAGVEKLRGVPFAERQTFAGEVPAKFQSLRAQELGGVQFGWREAMRQALDVFHTGYEHTESFEHLPQQQWSERVFPNAPSGVRTALEYPGRALAATDQFFRTLNYHMDMFGGAYAQARRELGAEATHAAVTERMTDILSHPPDELLANAERSAQRRVYQEHGKVDDWLLKGRDIGPMGFVIPFVRTPVAIVRQGFQLTPAGFSSHLHGTAPTARMSAQIRGEAAFGSTLMAGLAMGVATGMIKVHGTGPTDPVDRDKFYREGGRPNTVEIAGHNVGYSVLGPLAQPISLIANYFDAYQDAVNKGDKKNASQIAQQAAGEGMARAASSLKDQSFVRGLSDLNDVLSDPRKNWSRFFGGLASGGIPYAGAVRSVTQAIDPTLRQADTPIEYMETQIPGLSQNVPPRLRATGEPVQMEQLGGAAGRALLPMDVAKIQSTPVEQELDKHNVRLTFPEGQVRVWTKGPTGKEKSEPLTREDAVTVAEAKGQATMRQLEKVIASPGYQKAAPEIQAKQLAHVISGVRAAVHQRAVAAVHHNTPLRVEDLIPPGIAHR